MCDAWYGIDIDINVSCRSSLSMQVSDFSTQHNTQHERLEIAFQSDVDSNNPAADESRQRNFNTQWQCRDNIGQADMDARFCSTD